MENNQIKKPMMWCQMLFKPTEIGILNLSVQFVIGFVRIVPAAA